MTSSVDGLSILRKWQEKGAVLNLITVLPGKGFVGRKAAEPAEVLLVKGSKVFLAVGRAQFSVDFCDADFRVVGGALEARFEDGERWLFVERRPD